MSKRSQESSSLGSPTAKAIVCCLVSGESVSVGQDYSSNPESLGSTRDSQVWPWEEMKNPDGTLFSMPLETESTCEKSFKTWQTDSDTMKASRKHRWTPRRYTFQCGRDLCLHRCRQHCTWTRVTKRIWNYSRVVNLRTSKVRSELRKWSLKEIQKLRMYFPQTLQVHFGKNPCCLKNSNKVDEARVYVYLDSVLWMGKQHGPEDAMIKWTDQV